MKIFKVILFNENGHGQVPGGKDLLKIGFGIITLPVTLPFIILKEKLKRKKEKK